MITVNEGPLGKWFSKEIVLHWSSDPYLWTNYYIYFFVCLFVLIGNVFLVDGASWVSLLNMRARVSPTILVEDTFMTFLALMCNFMGTVYRSWGNGLRIHQILGSLKLIGVAKASNLFLTTFIHVKCLILSSLSPLRTPTRKRVGKRGND